MHLPSPLTRQFLLSELNSSQPHCFCLNHENVQTKQSKMAAPQKKKKKRLCFSCHLPSGAWPFRWIIMRAQSCEIWFSVPNLDSDWRWCVLYVSVRNTKIAFLFSIASFENKHWGHWVLASCLSGRTESLSPLTQSSMKFITWSSVVLSYTQTEARVCWDDTALYSLPLVYYSQYAKPKSVDICTEL